MENTRYTASHYKQSIYPDAQSDKFFTNKIIFVFLSEWQTAETVHQVMFVNATGQQNHALYLASTSFINTYFNMELLTVKFTNNFPIIN